MSPYYMSGCPVAFYKLILIAIMPNRHCHSHLMDEETVSDWEGQSWVMVQPDFETTDARHLGYPWLSVVMH